MSASWPRCGCVPRRSSCRACAPRALLTLFLAVLSQAQLEKAMNEALARLRSELEAAAAKDKADALAAQEAKLKVRDSAFTRVRPAVLTSRLLLAPAGRFPGGEGCAGG